MNQIYTSTFLHFAAIITGRSSDNFQKIFSISLHVITKNRFNAHVTSRHETTANK